ncbi:TPA: hypothetical protein QCY71_005714 [Bacillus cereus]|nr:hypothetical protein [Bacillus cereus]
MKPKSMFKFLGMAVVFGQLMTTPIVSHANTKQTQKPTNVISVNLTNPGGKIHFSAEPDRSEPNVIYKGKKYVLFSSNVIRI